MSPSAAADDWGKVATISTTMGVHQSRLCTGEGTRPTDIGCASTAPEVVAGGLLVDNGGLTVAGSISSAAISSTYVSATVLQINPSTMPCSSGLGGTIRYSSTSNTLEVCAGGNWTTLSSNTAPGNIGGTGSPTAIAVWDGANSLTYESTTTSGLYWDHANGRLGVGTNAPGDAVTVSGSTTQDTSLRLLNASNTLSAFIADGGSNHTGWLGYVGSGAGLAGRDGTVEIGSNNADILVRAGNTEHVRFTAGGPVGVGTPSPTATLQVSGTLTVSTTGQNTVASASLAVDTRGISVSSIIHLGSNGIVPIGAGGNVILSGTTAVSASTSGVGIFAGGAQLMSASMAGTTFYSPFSVSNTSGVTNTVIAAFSAGNGRQMKIEQPDPTDGNMPFIFQTSNAFQFMTDSNIGLLVDALGDVGVGIAPTASIANVAPNPGVELFQAGSIRVGNNAGTSGTAFIQFYRSGGVIGAIAQNGTAAVAYNTTSDRRMKENITETREGLQRLMQIGVKDFSFRADPSQTIVTGFIAQDLDKVFPEAVTTNGDNGETKLTSGTVPWSVDYGRVTPLIVKAVQDLNLKTEDEVRSLKAENDNLRRDVENLKREVGALKRAGR